MLLFFSKCSSKLVLVMTSCEDVNFCSEQVTRGHYRQVLSVRSSCFASRSMRNFLSVLVYRPRQTEAYVENKLKRGGASLLFTNDYFVSFPIKKFVRSPYASSVYDFMSIKEYPYGPLVASLNASTMNLILPGYICLSKLEICIASRAFLNTTL